MASQFTSMKKPTTGPIFYIILSAIIITLTGFSGYLYRCNLAYSKLNRELIIQNDSIISVNIELTRKLDGKTSGNGQNSGISFKTGRTK
jgi:hypothetical protein